MAEQQTEYNVSTTDRTAEMRLLDEFLSEFQRVHTENEEQNKSEDRERSAEVVEINTEPPQVVVDMPLNYSRHKLPVRPIPVRQTIPLDDVTQVASTAGKAKRKGRPKKLGATEEKLEKIRQALLVSSSEEQDRIRRTYLEGEEPELPQQPQPPTVAFKENAQRIFTPVVLGGIHQGQVAIPIAQNQHNSQNNGLFEVGRPMSGADILRQTDEALAGATDETMSMINRQLDRRSTIYRLQSAVDNAINRVSTQTSSNSTDPLVNAELTWTPVPKEVYGLTRTVYRCADRYEREANRQVLDINGLAHSIEFCNTTLQEQVVSFLGVLNGDVRIPPGNSFICMCNQMMRQYSTAHRSRIVMLRPGIEFEEVRSDRPQTQRIIVRVKIAGVAGFFVGLTTPLMLEARSSISGTALRARTLTCGLGSSLERTGTVDRYIISADCRFAGVRALQNGLIRPT